MNIVEPILLQCRWQPLALALHAPGTIFNSVTYERLNQYTHNVSAKARELGMKRGGVAALFIRDPILHSIFILGLAHAGVITVSAREKGLPAELQPDVVLTDDSSLFENSKNRLFVDQSWALDNIDGALALAPAQFDDEEPCRIALTSGTTGESKAIARSSRQIYVRTLRFQTTLGNRLPGCSRIFIDIGLSAGIGFSFLIHTLSRGGTAFMSGPNVLRTIEALVAYRVQAMIGSPKSLAELAELSSRMRGFGGLFDVVVSIGSALTPALADRVRTQLCPHVISMYGSSEVGHVAGAPAEAIAKIEGAVGYVVPGVEVDIVDASGKKLPAGEKGLVRIRSESVLGGYIGDPELTRSRFKEDGFYPGDIGTLTSDGVLVISGREGTIINLGGEKVSPERIEAVLTSFPSVSDAGVFPVPTVVGVQVLGSAIVWRGEADLPTLKTYLSSKLSRPEVPIIFMSVDVIPRNATGKVDRARLKQLSVTRPTKETRPN